MYVAKDSAQLIEARDGVLRLMQAVPLTDEERTVAEGDVTALNRYIENRKHVPLPVAPRELYIFNRVMWQPAHSDADGLETPASPPSMDDSCIS
jgi:hypothetical protein